MEVRMFNFNLFEIHSNEDIFKTSTPSGVGRSRSAFGLDVELCVDAKMKPPAYDKSKMQVSERSDEGKEEKLEGDSRSTKTYYDSVK